MSAPVRDRYPIAIRLYPYAKCADQKAAEPARRSVVVIGGGPVGLATALDLGRKGHEVVLVDDHDGAGQGSRAICFAKRTLEIANRLGAGAAMLEKGVVWRKGRVFHDEDEIYDFDLLPETGHRCPAFINLSQVHFERFLVEAIEAARAEGARIELRGKNRLDALRPDADGAMLDLMTPDGPYSLRADWVIACDGARSPVREMLGLGFQGRVFEDNFLIADVRMKADFPTERWFWFEPWFKSGASALLHKQPDDIWRIDFQLGSDIDRVEEMREERIRARIDRMLGGDAAYELDWCSIYTFQCRRMDRFRHGRVIFAGDSAHQVSPFGARGANSGMQDADNLCWKLDLVLKGAAPESLLDSYDEERRYAADENILHSTRATDFLTPKSAASRTIRDAVLALSRRHPFARAFVNSGRLSQPSAYDGFPLFGDDALEGASAAARPGAPAPDAPLGEGFLLDRLDGDFALLALGVPVDDAPTTVDDVALRTLEVSADRISPELRARYLGDAPGAVYLVRPDQHIVARWRQYDAGRVRAAMKRAIGLAAP